MTVTFRDELGVVSINEVYCISFDGEKAYFTDYDGTDYTVKLEHLVSITEAE